MIMACVHVLSGKRPIGSIEDKIKNDTMICQPCIEVMCKEPIEEQNLPDDVHFVCSICVKEIGMKLK